MIASHSSIEVFANMRSRRMPALFTTASSRPNASIAAETSAADCSKSATSEPSTIASPPSRRTSAATSCAGLASAPSPPVVAPRSFTTTRAPWRASSSACSRPIPRPAPVTITTRPSQMPMSAPPARCPGEPAPIAGLCENPPVDWDDLRTFLAVARAGSLAEAARGLGRQLFDRVAPARGARARARRAAVRPQRRRPTS